MPIDNRLPDSRYLHGLKLSKLRDFRERRPDLEMMHAVLTHPDLSTVVIARDRLVVALRDKHKAPAKASIFLNSLVDVAFLVSKRRASAGFHELVASAYNQVEFAPMRT